MQQGSMSRLIGATENVDPGSVPGASGTRRWERFGVKEDRFITGEEGVLLHAQGKPMESEVRAWNSLENVGQRFLHLNLHQSHWKVCPAQYESGYQCSAQWAPPVLLPRMSSSLLLMPASLLSLRSTEPLPASIRLPPEILCI